MAVKKPSKAKAAAAAATSKTEEPPSGLMSKKMVETLIAAFNDPKLTPNHDEDAMHRLVDDFYRFVDVVARGAVDADALPLASEMLRMGHDWLKQNPKYIRINSGVWTKPLVEDTIRWFASIKGDAKNLKENVARFAAFERVWRSGLVEEGETALIAQAFVEHVKDWMRTEPAAQKAYDAL
jgi:hypothetical protein